MWEGSRTGECRAHYAAVDCEAWALLREQEVTPNSWNESKSSERLECLYSVLWVHEVLDFRRIIMEDYPYAVIVEGDWSTLNTKTLQTKMHVYFQSKKKSQGGDCVIRWSKLSCTVLFRSEESECFKLPIYSSSKGRGGVAHRACL